MLTIAYCCEKKDADFEEHLIKSSGLNGIEIIALEESDFAKAYNRVLKRAKHEIVLFLRHDIEMHSKNWGMKLLEHFKKSDYAILGVVGSVIVPMSGLVWENEEPLVGRIWYEQFEEGAENVFSGIFKGKIIPVIAIEDSFVACHRGRLNSPFNEIFIGDSFYDLDFCVNNYEKGGSIGVLFDVKLVKRCFNEQDDNWFENRKRFIKNHKNLPFRMKPDLLCSKTQMKFNGAPLLSLIVTTKDNPMELFSCLESIHEKSHYPNLEIFVVDKGSSPSNLKAIREFLQQYPRAKFIELPCDHLPTLYNEVVKGHISHASSLLLFCDSAVILWNDAISRMVKVYLDDPEECGTVGARLHTSNNMVRHFGLSLFPIESDEGFELGLGYQGFQSAYKYEDRVIKDVIGSSGEFLLISKEVFQKIKGFNTGYLHSLQDFELNIKTILAGKRNYLAGNGVAYFVKHGAPRFHQDDLITLVALVNTHLDVITPYVVN